MRMKGDPMTKKILITGATDGIGLEAAKMLAAEGCALLLHGRSAAKLDAAISAVGGDAEGYLADLSSLAAVSRLADEVVAKHDHLDVLINNAGILKTPQTVTADGHDIRFMVNTHAPYFLAKRLLPLMDGAGGSLTCRPQRRRPSTWWRWLAGKQWMTWPLIRKANWRSLCGRTSCPKVCPTAQWSYR